jgi:hypothetical protein
MIAILAFGCFCAPWDIPVCNTTGLNRNTESSPFSRKRTKKLLSVLTRTFPDKSATAQIKAFCFFFSKKKALPCFL